MEVQIAYLTISIKRDFTTGAGSASAKIDCARSDEDTLIRGIAELLVSNEDLRNIFNKSAKLATQMRRTEGN